MQGNILKRINHIRIRGWIAVILFLFLLWALGSFEQWLTFRLADLWTSVGLRLPGASDAQVRARGLICTCIARTLIGLALTAMAATIVRRPPLSFGLRPLRLRQYGSGLCWGAVIFATLFSIVIVSGAATVRSADVSWLGVSTFGTAWLVGMSFVALSEEIDTRGAPLLLLAELTSPSIACAATVLAFVAPHMTHSGETVWGLTQVTLFGLACALSVLVTRSLWWAIGFHTSWDYVQDYIFGAIGSGYRFQGSLLSSTPAGPTWLSGGSAGPEGSIFSCFAMLAVASFWGLRLLQKART